jgi:hypothetical protein
MSQLELPFPRPTLDLATLTWVFPDDARAQRLNRRGYRLVREAPCAEVLRLYAAMGTCRACRVGDAVSAALGGWCQVCGVEPEELSAGTWAESIRARAVQEKT